GRVTMKLGGQERARELFERAIRIEEAVDLPSRDRLAHAKNELALVVGAMGDPARKRSLLLDAIAIRTMDSAEALRELAVNYFNLAALDYDEGHLEASRESLRRAVDLLRAAGDRHALQLARTLRESARVNADLGDRVSAL